ncbi:hypothetical protein DUZ99_14475 [Xylanibacillus composti]|uniref:Uncharacterized protein n=1 Tax=Xylanibacillus composti TaxID=1572762 RepID=A0A8J4H932_9BACL|nr:hypothetical protein [Xylanibacillus composti]MDT9726180.1 hypothetical protein [Xylanibacillus composti]MDT9726183.1 hypothetical protein [Xylanibacillus composti]GIQ71499.1 hypothetical protein XYCOK13_43230 [Xylanibacillus composti]
MENKTLSSLLNDLHKIIVFARYLVSSNYEKDAVIEILQTIEGTLTGVSNGREYERAAFIERILEEVSGDPSVMELFSDSLRDPEYSEITDNESEIMKYLPVIDEVMKEARMNYNEGNAEKSHDLLDCIHNLPVLLLNKKNWKAKVFWKTSMKHYREKWQDDDFLVQEEQRLIPQPLFKRWMS